MGNPFLPQKAPINPKSRQNELISADFFLQNAQSVARKLLGKVLAVSGPGLIRREIIHEVEVYAGYRDKASHASRGKTPRNQPMFETGGHIYVYLCYGVHEMLNLVVGKKHYPAAILIRGAGNFAGPGRLTKNLGIDRRFNGKVVGRETGLWLEDAGLSIPAGKIRRTPRIGVDYAGKEWALKPYRYLLERDYLKNLLEIFAGNGLP